MTGVRDQYRTLHDIVLSRMTGDIISGKLGPGEKLNEPELAAQYGVSRGPVREALKLLSGKGLVQIIPGKGARVTRLSKDEIVEIYEIRIALEGLAARLGVRHADDRTVDSMRKTLEAMRQSLHDSLKWLDLNMVFHMTLYQVGGAQRLVEMIEDLSIKTDPLVHSYLADPKLLARVHAHHPPILAAVEARDEVLAEKLTQQSLRLGIEIFATADVEFDSGRFYPKRGIRSKAAERSRERE